MNGLETPGASESVPLSLPAQTHRLRPPRRPVHDVARLDADRGLLQSFGEQDEILAGPSRAGDDQAVEAKEERRIADLLAAAIVEFAETRGIDAKPLDFAYVKP